MIVKAGLATMSLVALQSGAEAQGIKKSSTKYSWANLPKIAQPVFKKDTLSITKYGAKNDGLTLNTQSIQSAIDACSKKGGGVVLVPAGLWITGPLVLKNGVNLHIASAAILQFTGDKTQYALVEGNYEGRRTARNQSPISAEGAESIAVTGKGIVDGNGDVWRAMGRDRQTENEWKKRVASGGAVSDDGRMWYPSEAYKQASKQGIGGVLEGGKTVKDFESYKDFFRPNLVVFTNCKKVLLEGVTFQNSAAWCLHPIMCENLTVRNVYAKNPANAQNGDGIDVESCNGVLVEGSTFDVGDDGICVKSGKDEEGRKRGKPTENMIVRNCVVYKAHGGFVVGSEMSGGARNIFVENCNFMGTDKGLRFKTTRGRGGVVENIYCRNIYMKDIIAEAIFFDMYYFSKPTTEVPPVTEATPQFQNMWIDNIVCNGANKGIYVRGLPEMAVKNINISNVILQAGIGAELIEADGINIKNVQLFDTKSKAIVSIDNSKNITIDNLKFGSSADAVMSISGNRSANIKLLNTDNGNAKERVEYKDGASEKATASL